MCSRSVAHYLPLLPGSGAQHGGKSAVIEPKISILRFNACFFIRLALFICFNVWRCVYILISWSLLLSVMFMSHIGGLQLYVTCFYNVTYLQIQRYGFSASLTLITKFALSPYIWFDMKWTHHNLWPPKCHRPGNLSVCTAVRIKNS